MARAQSAASSTVPAAANDPVPGNAGELFFLEQMAKKVLWLSTWTIHNANHVRPSRDGLKVGGHQASSASCATILTALYGHVLRPEDRVAVKPHASPAYHGIQYLFGRQTQENLERFRALGGAQSYPSRTKDVDDVDFSTGSVGLGAAMTNFAALVQDYIALKKEGEQPRGRMVAIVGDAELDEGNCFEALLEGWKHDVRNVWWVIDYNRQSLDAVVNDRLFTRIDGLFHSMGWNVVTLKYGKRLEAAFREPDGDALRRWIDDCPNSLYSVLVYQGGAAWRRQVTSDLGHLPGIAALLERHDDDALHALMTDLGGQCMETLVEAFDGIDNDLPTCFIAYTIKGKGLPFAGHKDNHAGLMNPDQMAEFQRRMGVEDGQEWDRFAGLDLPSSDMKAFLDRVPFFADVDRRHECPLVPVPEDFPRPHAARMSTQEGFGRILTDLARGKTELADRIVTTSPDVTVSTNLGGWVNQRGLFARSSRQDTFREERVVSAQRWAADPSGQHLELGIAEHNLFLLLAALGLSGPLFGELLIPIGTIYDPFVKRGLDAFNYALYQDARFMLVATPSGVTLAPEGGAHQSIATPLIGMGLPNLAYFEPGHVDELAEIMRWGFGWMQADDGGSLYLRLSTRALPQPEREMTPALARGVIEGGYWLREPERGSPLAIAYLGAMAAEAQAAADVIAEDLPGVGVLAVTSPDRLHDGWLRERRGEAADSAIGRLLAPLAPDAGIVTLVDGHPSTLGWLGSVGRHRVAPLGVEHFGQSADIIDVYRLHGLDVEAVLDAAARLLVERTR